MILQLPSETFRILTIFIWFFKSAFLQILYGTFILDMKVNWYLQFLCSHTAVDFGMYASCNEKILGFFPHPPLCWCHIGGKKRKNANEPTLLFFSVNYGWWVLLPSLKVAVVALVARGWNFSSQEGEFSPFIILDVEKAPATLVCGLFFLWIHWGKRGFVLIWRKELDRIFLWLKLQLPRRRSVAKNTWIQMT